MIYYWDLPNQIEQKIKIIKKITKKIEHNEKNIITTTETIRDNRSLIESHTVIKKNIERKKENEWKKPSIKVYL